MWKRNAARFTRRRVLTNDEAAVSENELETSEYGSSGPPVQRF